MKKKVVFVSGGDKGIGLAIVEKMAENDYQVISTYNVNKKGAKLLENKYQNVEFFQCNVLNYIRVKNVIRTILKKYKNVDIVVNNLGAFKDQSFVKMTKNNWDNIIDINLKSLYYFTHDFLNGMIKNNWGRIINISSIAAQQGGFGKTNYSAAKSGMIGFTKSLSLEVASKGVTVNAIAPGAIDADMFWAIPEKYRKQIVEAIPMKRIGQPQEVAELVYFLSGDNAAFITGQMLSINGGAY
ncbi:MAG: 3-oxoacyl-ACP reductase FabG [Candidatus Omnitrophota bacterium]